MTKLEFLAFLLFDDDARAEDLPATLTEKRAGFLIDSARSVTHQINATASSTS